MWKMNLSKTKKTKKVGQIKSASQPKIMTVIILVFSLGCTRASTGV